MRDRQPTWHYAAYCGRGGLCLWILGLLLLPLVSVLYGVWAVKSAAGPMGQMFDFGIGCYLSALSALVIAAGGVKNFLAGG